MPSLRRAAVVAAALSVALPATAAARTAPPVAPSAYAPNQVLVTFQPGTPRALQRGLLRAYAAIGYDRVRELDTIIAWTPRDPAVVAAALDRLPVVDYAEVNPRLAITRSVPDDPRFGELYGLDDPQDDDLDAPEAWTLAGLGSFPSSGGVKVGVVDTGIRRTHQDLAGSVTDCARSQGFVFFGGSIQSGCTDDNGHGTHVAGTIAATADNGVGVAGVAFDASLAICKALGGPLGSGSTTDVANCVTWLADRGAQVINMSLGGGASQTLRRAVQYANGRGALVVAAAGNDGDGTQNYPAAYPEVVSVAATDASDQRASFSNANADVELAAAGVDVLSTSSRSNTAYEELSGTSMASPHVAGAAAVLVGEGLTPPAARTRLQQTADDLGAGGRDPAFGFGRISLQGALTPAAP